MKYKDFNGPIEELVSMKLKEIEEKENIRIIHAVESGSRSWGFASPDSDYDVRFIYIRPKNEYLKLDKNKDFIEWQLDETLDINGWDLDKCLKLFYKSNTTLFEWANSPIVYKTTDTWKNIYKEAENYFSCKAAMYHYYGTAKSNYMKYLLEENVKYKKYFYVLRPILCCKWIEEKKCPPPVLFDTLRKETLSLELKPFVDKLLEEKVKMNEADKAKRIDEINNYIEKQLKYYEELVSNMKDDRNKDISVLNKIFIENI